MNVIDRAKQIASGAETVIDWLGSGGATVDFWHSQKRADICMKCPENKEGGVVVGAVAAAIRRQIELKNKLELRVDGEKSLHSCEKCGCVLRLKVHVPIANLGLDKQELESYPAWCWMRDEFNQQQTT